MSYLYVAEQGAVISINEERFQVKYKDGMVRSIPAETLEVIEVFGKVQITTQCIEECLKRSVNIIFYSSYGAYFGRLISTNHVNVQRQRLQAKKGEDENFNLALSKSIVEAKIHNQLVVIRRYAQTGRGVIDQDVSDLKDMIYKAREHSRSVEQLMGY